MSNDDTSNFKIDGEFDPVLRLVRGESYSFNINAPGNPFWIKTLPGVSFISVLSGRRGVREGKGEKREKSSGRQRIQIRFFVTTSFHLLPLPLPPPPSAAVSFLCVFHGRDW